MAESKNVLPVEVIANRIYIIRGQKVMLDRDLAQLYGVETKVLVQAVKRNIERFPQDFMFRLDKKEFIDLRSQFVTSKNRGGRRYLPYAFTEQGIAMLSGVLNSPRAIAVNIAIMRTFVKIREYLSSNKEILSKLEQHDRQIKTIFEVLNKLLMPPPEEPKRRIGFCV